jgi:hypothetical protein
VRLAGELREARGVRAPRDGAQQPIAVDGDQQLRIAAARAGVGEPVGVVVVVPAVGQHQVVVGVVAGDGQGADRDVLVLVREPDQHLRCPWCCVGTRR